MKKITFLLIVTSICMFRAQAQTVTDGRVNDNRFNAWYMVFLKAQMSDKFSIKTAAQLRRSGWATLRQDLYGISVKYKCSDKISIGGGFAHLDSYSSEPKKTGQEQRTFQQVTVKNSGSKVSLSNRYRLEQRWRESGESEYLFTNRARYRLSLVIPFSSISIQAKRCYLRIYNEIFINFGKNVQKNIFDQNRLYAAIGFKLGKNSDLQLGYLNRKAQKSDGIHFENNHTLQFGFTQNLDFR